MTDGNGKGTAPKIFPGGSGARAAARIEPTAPTKGLWLVEVC